MRKLNIYFVPLSTYTTSKQTMFVPLEPTRIFAHNMINFLQIAKLLNYKHLPTRRSSLPPQPWKPSCSFPCLEIWRQLSNLPPSRKILRSLWNRKNPTSNPKSIWYCSDLLTDILDRLLTTSKYSDMTITCQGYVFKVHCAVVCTRSKPLAASIDGNFKVCVLSILQLP